MYERFTDRARYVMLLANREARRLNHEYIGTEHILLGLIQEGSGVAANVLKNLVVDLRKIRLEVEKLVSCGPEEPGTDPLPKTPRAKKVIEYAMAEARALGHDYIGTEHVLLGLLREDEGVAAQVLMNLGLRLDAVREEILALLGHRMEVSSPPDQSEPMKPPPTEEARSVLRTAGPDGGKAVKTDPTTKASRKRGGLQFSIRELMGFAAFVAIGCAALLNANAWWNACLATAAIAALLVAVLAAVYLRGPGRAFWFGFALFGWVYVAILFWPTGLTPSGTSRESVANEFLTARLLVYAYQHHPRAPPVPPGAAGGGFFAVGPDDRGRRLPGSGYPGSPSYVQVPAQGGSPFAPPNAPAASFIEATDFFSVGQWLWAILLAWIGGLLARFFASRTPRAAGPP